MMSNNDSSLCNENNNNLVMNEGKDKDISEDRQVSPLENYYDLKKQKKLSKEIKELIIIDNKKLLKIKEILSDAKTHYTSNYVESLIEWGRYFRKELIGLNLEEDSMNRLLQNIKDLENCQYGTESSKISDILDAVVWINKLEERLVEKGIIRGKSIANIITERIARKESDSE